MAGTRPWSVAARALWSCWLQGFRVEFEVNIIASFEEGYLVSENLPIRLYREKKAVG